ncbi:Importin subunit beta-5 [Golovinomyces cichoracearum]|uniref:Importin subunit beta-5 n=1 Tax=Golovinomyces cichoracearum TaxID=62708 RepID=A0A420IPV4_9PEZI|nr:Importin subunit beta-5 [Golovinomyces cichoracearum]
MAATTEDQLLRLIAETHNANEIPRKQAEQHLSKAERNPTYPVSLTAIASHCDVALEIRQSALLQLRSWIKKYWIASDQQEIPNHGPVILDDKSKDQLRNNLLKLATSGDSDRKIRNAASYAVTKIASVDFPHQWPSLLPTLLHIIPDASDQQLNGALKVLSDLIEDSLSENQFFLVARDLLKVVYDVAANDARKPVLRALAISIFRASFDIMEMVKDEHGPEVKGFAEEALKAWLPLFLGLLKLSLPSRAEGKFDSCRNGAGDLNEYRRGIIALKLQVVKTLMKIRSVFPKLLLPQIPLLFSATWTELNFLKDEYQLMYIENEEQGRLEDADGLPYTLDFLVLEELDFLQSCLKVPPVQKELDLQLQRHPSIPNSSLVLDFMNLAVSYAQIIKEEEDLWDIDVNLFLAEETCVTTNYTPRTACGDLLIKIGEWLHQGALEGLLIYGQRLFSDISSTWRIREAVLYLLTQLLNDFMDVGKKVAPEIVGAYFELIEYAISRTDEHLLRARGYLVAGVVIQSIPDVSLDLLNRTIKSINDDASEVVKVACIKSIQGWAKNHVPAEHQVSIIGAISEYLYSKDLTELEDADDLLVTLVETLRAAIKTNPNISIGDSPVLDLLFTMAKHGAQNFQMTMLVTETFEEIVQNFSGTNLYTQLCLKVLPSLTGAFDVGNITENNPLVELATELLAVLTENGSEPLPAGFVAASLPKLSCLLMATNEGSILRAGAEAVKFMLMHDHQQVFAWHDEHNKSGLEVCLILTDKLLNPMVEDIAASEVGGLAAELVEKAGRERLGPYLEQLLRAVASRLATAEAPPFIQSLTLVFARLSLTSEHDVIDFLCQIDINGINGLQVVMSKWLENSINFAGYDEIRQNVIALSKLYSLNDPRLVQTMVRGDQIMPASNVIVTRSRAKKNPVEYTIIPAPLKIIKILIEELLSASGMFNLASSAAIATAIDDEEDKDDWEDDPSSLDLSSTATKAGLMSFAEANFIRQRDNETQNYLTDFFLRAARENVGGFSNWYAGLTAEEKSKLEKIAHDSSAQVS